MIVGIGIDLCDTNRVRSLLDRYGERFVDRVFTESERGYCRNDRRRHECLGGRFAAKEAALKAIGTGLSQGIRWKDVELVTSERQPPRIEWHGRAAEIAAERGMKTCHVTITHDGGMAVAVVILEG